MNPGRMVRWRGRHFHSSAYFRTILAHWGGNPCAGRGRAAIFYRLRGPRRGRRARMCYCAARSSFPVPEARLVDDWKNKFLHAS